jgi:hypothetical protein
LRAPAGWERPPPAFDGVGDLVEVDDANLPPELAAAISAVLAPAARGAVRLSALLDAARGRGDPPRLTETVWAACLWVWVSDHAADEDAQPCDEGLSQLLATLAAHDDGTLLADPEFGGPDLVVGSQVPR